MHTVTGARFGRAIKGYRLNLECMWGIGYVGRKARVRFHAQLLHSLRWATSTVGCLINRGTNMHAIKHSVYQLVKKTQEKAQNVKKKQKKQ